MAIPDPACTHTGTPSDEVVRVEGLVNRFGSQTVHDGLSLSVRRGEILGIVGGSGTGKSVLMRSILGLHRPTGGHIEVLGLPVPSTNGQDRQQIARHTGVLFQDGALFSSLTVAENVQVPLREHFPDLDPRWLHELSLLKVTLAGLPPLPWENCRPSSPAACASAPVLPVHWHWTHRCCSWTNQPLDWTPSGPRPLTASS